MKEEVEGATGAVEGEAMEAEEMGRQVGEEETEIPGTTVAEGAVGMAIEDMAIRTMVEEDIEEEEEEEVVAEEGGTKRGSKVEEEGVMAAAMVPVTMTRGGRFMAGEVEAMLEAERSQRP